MTDEQYEALRARLRVAIDKWDWIVTRFGYIIDLAWCRHEHDDRGEKSVVAMKVDADWQYLNAQVSIFLPTIQRVIIDATYDEPEKDERLERLVIHELIHVILDELRPADPSAAYEAHEERVTETLARIVQQADRWSRDAEDAKRKSDPEAPSGGAAGGGQEGETRTGEDREEVTDAPEKRNRPDRQRAGADRPAEDPFDDPARRAAWERRYGPRDWSIRSG